MGKGELVTAAEAANILGLSKMRVHQMIDEGKLSVVQTVGAQSIKLLNGAEVKRLKRSRGKG